MNIGVLAKMLNVAISVGPKVKGWIFSDGKFNFKRALLLLAFFVALVVSVQFIGVTDTAVVVDMLDDISDAIGYLEQ